MLGAALGFALLLGTAAWRKLSDFGTFSAVMADYRIVPRALLRPTGVVVGAVEAALAVLWLAAPWYADAANAAGIGTAALMAGYGAAIAVEPRAWALLDRLRLWRRRATDVGARGTQRGSRWPGHRHVGSS